MRNFPTVIRSIGFLGVLCVLTASLAFFPLQHVQAQTGGTKLELMAYWDNGKTMSGTATLTHTDASNATVTDFAGSLSRGRVQTTIPIQPNILYTVNIATTNPLTNSTTNYSLQFLVPSLILNPASIVSATYKVTISRTNNLPVHGETSVSIQL